MTPSTVSPVAACHICWARAAFASKRGELAEVAPLRVGLQPAPVVGEVARHGNCAGGHRVGRRRLDVTEIELAVPGGQHAGAEERPRADAHLRVVGGEDEVATRTPEQLLDPGAGERDVVGRAPQRVELDREAAVRAVEWGDEPVTRTEVDICEVAAGVGCDPRHLGDERDPLGRRHAGRVDDGTSGRDLPDRDVAHIRGSRGELVDRADLPADEGQHPHRDERRVGGVPVRRVELGLGRLQRADVVTLEQGVGRHRRTESLQLVDADLRVLPGVKELDSGVRDPHTQDHQDERDPDQPARSAPSSALRAVSAVPARFLHHR